MINDSNVVNPRLIVENILATMHDKTMEGYDVSYVPNVYWVYLHRETLEQFGGLQAKIREQAVRALHKELRKMNGSRSIPIAGRFLNSDGCFETLGEWRVEFRSNDDENAQPGEVVVLAEAQDDVGQAEAKRKLDGSETVRVDRAGGEEDGTRRTPGFRPASVGVTYALLKYSDDLGEQTFAMNKDLIKIGRGGRDYLVDLKIVGKKDISQEHCHIRRDPASNKFFVKDMSRFGTLIDGKRLAGSVDRSGPEVRDLHLEEPLADNSVITLADVISLKFKVVKK